jgi:hypothetical protein
MATATAERSFTTSTSGRDWVRTFGRIGIASRGVIYVVLAYLAFDIARHGSAPAQAPSTGALEEVGHRTGGSALLILLAVGLGSYAMWRLVNAAMGGGAASPVSDPRPSPSSTLGYSFEQSNWQWATRRVAGHPPILSRWWRRCWDAVLFSLATQPRA